MFRRVERKSYLWSLVGCRLVAGLGFFAYCQGPKPGRTQTCMDLLLVMHRWGCPRVKNVVISSMSLRCFLIYLGISHVLFVYSIIFWKYSQLYVSALLATAFTTVNCPGLSITGQLTRVSDTLLITFRLWRMPIYKSRACYLFLRYISYRITRFCDLQVSVNQRESPKSISVVRMI